MPKRRRRPERVTGRLRQAEVELAQGRAAGEVRRRLEVSEASPCRRRSEHGGLKVDRAKRMREPERENARPERAVAELTPDERILPEAAEGNR